MFGIPLLLMTDREQNPRAFLEIRGRLDLLEIWAVEHEGWRKSPSNQ